jgi:hypothetical protein
MPVHDWKRVTAGTFHDFHLAWVAELRRALNGGLLPPGYYALAEPGAGDIIPDVLTLHHSPDEPELGGFKEVYPGPARAAVLTVAETPPRVSVTDTTSEAITLALRQRQIAIRHTTGDRIVALIEIISPGNKESAATLRAFLEKAVAALQAGYHLLMLDLWPPGRFDPAGLHGLLWALVGGTDYRPPKDRPLTLAAYHVRAQGLITTYVEPLSVGVPLPDMPRFLAPGQYVNVPLEATYGAAWEGVPERWRRVLEAGGQRAA